MTFLFILAFLLLIVGAFLLLQLSPLDLVDQVNTFAAQRKTKLKKSVALSKKPVKLRGIKRIVKEAQDILAQENDKQKWPQLILASMGLAALGLLISSALNNVFLAPVLAGGLGLMPFLLISFSYIRKKKGLNAALETALSTITSSYLRTESIVTAVRENVDHLDPIIRPTFERFLVQADLISSDLMAGLETMKRGIDSPVFHEWIDAMKLCQKDRNLKSTLLPIVNKMSDMRVVSGELNILLYQPLKVYVIMALFLVLEIPFIRILNEEWYLLLMNTVAGKIVITIDVILLLISFVNVIRSTRPIEYRR